VDLQLLFKVRKISRFLSGDEPRCSLKSLRKTSWAFLRTSVAFIGEDARAARID